MIHLLSSKYIRYPPPPSIKAHRIQWGLTNSRLIAVGWIYPIAVCWYESGFWMFHGKAHISPTHPSITISSPTFHLPPNHHATLPCLLPGSAPPSIHFPHIWITSQVPLFHVLLVNNYPFPPYPSPLSLRPLPSTTCITFCSFRASENWLNWCRARKRPGSRLKSVVAQ